MTRSSDIRDWIATRNDHARKIRQQESHYGTHPSVRSYFSKYHEFREGAWEMRKSSEYKRYLDGPWA